MHVRPERICDAIRADLSARLDGEVDAGRSAALDDHLAGCADCRRHEEELRGVRRALRLAPAEDVPDLSPRIMDRVIQERTVGRRRAEWRARIRTGAIAAAATAALLIGTGAPWLDRPADVARADEIVAGVRTAARSLTAYRATYRVTETGWHQRIGLRTMVARVWFEAPESFRVEIDDLTDYPRPRWPLNDVSIVARDDRYWVSEPASCPVEALPACADPGERREQTVLQRSPFDGATRLPTDVVVPLETVAASRGFDIEGITEVAGRQAIRLRLAYRDAIPLVASLEGGGSWRPFHPLDRVDLWIDATTWFPLRYQIAAGDSIERVEWARANEVSDRAGEVLLDVRATSFRQPSDISDGVFQVPASGDVTSERFRPGGVDLLGPQAPASLAGLEPYRGGRTPGGTVLSYARGLTWLKVTISEPTRGDVASADPAVTDEIVLGSGSHAYYRPAAFASSRSLDVFGTNQSVHLESNLPRDRLLEVASSLGVEGRRIEPRSGVDRVGPGSLPDYALLPTRLPAGYTLADTDAAIERGASERISAVVLYVRSPEAEYDGVGIRITQKREAALVPTSEETVAVSVEGTPARWSVERGELEWIDDGVYRAVSAPSFDLATALTVAEGLK
jgi:Putative zinc-finger